MPCGAVAFTAQVPVAHEAGREKERTTESLSFCTRLATIRISMLIRAQRKPRYWIYFPKNDL